MQRVKGRETGISPGTAPPRVSGGLPFFGHLLELRRQPIALMQRVVAECGEIGSFGLGRQSIVLLTGAEASEAFFRAPDEQLDQAAAYPFMKPIFGAGVVFDAPVEQRKQAIRNRALRDQFMRGHAEVIAAETERMCRQIGDTGELDLVDFFGELTTFTSSSTLIGKEFREDLGPLGSEFARTFQDLERGTDALAYLNPHLPLPSFRRRDRARERLVELISGILEDRRDRGSQAGDLLQVVENLKDEQGNRRYSRSEITGMIIGIMFAGHHTSQAASAWTLIELLRHPDCLQDVVHELEDLYADGREVSHQALREIPLLEAVLKETLRMHPPLIILMRKVQKDFQYKQFTVRAGNLVAVSPAVSNRLPGDFKDPDRFDVERYAEGRREDLAYPWTWIPFGGGRHKCVGSAFALMQLKTIFSILLRRYEFSLSSAPESYANDHSKMVVQLKQPARVRYRLRRTARAAQTGRKAPGTESTSRASGSLRIRVDRDLCQGHGMCMGEAPELFRLNDANELQLLAERPEPELRHKAELAVRYCPTGALSLEED